MLEHNWQVVKSAPSVRTQIGFAPSARSLDAARINSFYSEINHYGGGREAPHHLAWTSGVALAMLPPARGLDRKPSETNVSLA